LILSADILSSIELIYLVKQAIGTGIIGIGVACISLDLMFIILWLSGISNYARI
jgi:hypothetical protein